jgi:ATP-dependent DNA ligase
MPLFRRSLPPAPQLDPDDWRPQRFGRSRRSMRDPIVEPSWSGVRVLARVNNGSVGIIDEDGIDCTAEFAAIASAVAASALASELILDGFLTVEPTQVKPVGPLEAVQAPTGGQMMTQLIVGSRVGRRPTFERHLDPDRPIAFVAVDLLQIDGSRLLDVPLLERKRLLDGSLRPGDLVRITPFVRPPVASYVPTWRSAGFNALVYKNANSRYLPDARNDDWSIFPMPFK